jgi:hypothetical protein
MSVPMTIPPVIQPGHIAQFMIHLRKHHFPARQPCPSSARNTIVALISIGDRRT